MDFDFKDKITIQKTTKFNTVAIKIVLVNEFSKENASKYSLLTKVLANTTKKYNTKLKLANKMCDLYDASIYISSSNIHKANLLSFTLRYVNDKCVEDYKLTDEVIKLLYEVIHNPNVSNGEFDHEVFDDEKKQQIAQITKIYNNKNRYAVRQAIKHMCPNEIVSVSSLGELEDLEKITPKSLFDFYNEIIETSKLLIFVNGDVDDNIRKKLEKFNFIGNKYNGKSFDLYKKSDVLVDKVKEIKEIQDVNQAKLIMGFRLKTSSSDNDKHVMSLFSLMFGGLYCSNLFINVRENNSLAYDISSQMKLQSKIMFVIAGIDSDNYDKTVAIIKEELNKYVNGEIDEELLEIAKVNMISDINEIEDYQNDHIVYKLNQFLLNKDQTYDEIIDKINSVTVQDIQRKASEISLDTIFLLSNK